MLQAIRDKITGWLAYLIIFLIAIPFALWGVSNYTGGGNRSVAITVNGQEISQQELDRAIAQERQRINEMFDGNVPAGLLEQMNLPQQVEKRLIDEVLLRQFAEKYGLTTTIADFQQTVMAMPVFQDATGNFSREIYTAQLNANGFTIPQFEQQLRWQLALQQFYQGLGGKAFVPPGLLAAKAAFSQQERDVAYVLWSLESALPETLSLKAKETYLSQNPERFQTELKVKINYLNFSPEDLAKNFSTSDDSILENIYHAQKARFTTEASLQARHILLTLPKAASTEEQARRRAELEALRARIVAGEDFATLAKTYSEDPGSASVGGDLGEVTRGMMVPPFEAALFALTLEAPLSPIVESQFGLHLILLTDIITPEETQPFAEVKTLLAEEDRLQRAQSAFYAEVDRLSTLVFENPENLQAIAELLNLPLQQSDWFTQDPNALYLDIAKETAVRGAAFSPEVQAGKVSDLIELADGSVVVLQVAEKKLPETKAFAEVALEIEEILKKEQASEKINTAAETWRQRLQDLATVDAQALLTEAGLTLKQAPTLQINSRDSDLSVEFQAQVFQLPAKTWQVLTANNGDVALLRVEKIQEGDFATLPAATQQSLRSNLESSWQQLEETLLFKTLYETAKIVRNSRAQP